MFTVRLTEETRPGASVMARAPTLEGATGFVREYCGLDFGVIPGWEERNGLYVMDICDWLDCWFANPPVVARIITPRGFTPSKMTDFVSMIEPGHDPSPRAVHGETADGRSGDRRFALSAYSEMVLRSALAELKRREMRTTNP
jgi:hypothetical protein